MIVLELIGALLLVWLVLECCGLGLDWFAQSDVAQGVAILAAIAAGVAILR